MAFGDITLTSAMRATLVSLQRTEELSGRSQERLATGKKVNSALDNPTNFFAARAHTQRAGLLDGLKDNINEAIQGVKAADAGLTAINGLLESIRGVVTQARTAIASTTSAAELAGLATQYETLMTQIDNTQTDTTYKGTNFLDSSVLTVNFNADATTSLSVSGFDGSSTGLAVSVVAAAGDLDTTAKLDAIEVTINDALGTLRTEGASLAASLAILTNRRDFNTNLINTLTTGAGLLTNADTNEEGANLLLLQTRQQLGTTSLSLASQQAQSVLRLF